MTSVHKIVSSVVNPNSFNGNIKLQETYFKQIADPLALQEYYAAQMKDYKQQQKQRILLEVKAEIKKLQRMISELVNNKGFALKHSLDANICDLDEWNVFDIWHLDITDLNLGGTIRDFADSIDAKIANLQLTINDIEQKLLI